MLFKFIPLGHPISFVRILNKETSNQYVVINQNLINHVYFLVFCDFFPAIYELINSIIIKLFRF